MNKNKHSHTAPFTTYGETVMYRVIGADRASQYGAIGVLVRSVTPYSLYTCKKKETKKETKENYFFNVYYCYIVSLLTIFYLYLFYFYFFFFILLF